MTLNAESLSPAAEPLLELVRATDAEVIRQVWTHNRNHFAPNAPLDGWLARAALRMTVDLGPDMGHKIWILVPKGKAHDPSAILSAVHTIERPGLLASLQSKNTSSTTTPDNVELREVVIAFVLLVYTAVEHRNRGYAKTMLKMLRDQMKRQLHPKIELSYLFSGVGPTFYAKAGWRTIRSRVLEIEPQSHVFPQLAMESDTLAGYRAEDIAEWQLDDVLDKDLKLLRSDLVQHAMTASQHRRFAIVIPDPRAFHKHFEIIQLSNSMINRVDKPITRVGMQLIPETTQGACKGQQAFPFIIWTYVSSENNLHILRVRYRTIAQLQYLLKQAVKEARERNLATVSIWDLKEEDAILATGGSNKDRTYAWSCLTDIWPESVDRSGDITSDTPSELLFVEGFTWGL
ncbi:hypothetical protein EDD11_007790 [Mortierella claussenii]|nr:hypothetical protein EDD11_007790 [Mortierella claussenii]